MEWKLQNEIRLRFITSGLCEGETTLEEKSCIFLKKYKKKDSSPFDSVVPFPSFDYIPRKLSSLKSSGEVKRVKRKEEERERINRASCL